MKIKIKVMNNTKDKMKKNNRINKNEFIKFNIKYQNENV